MDVFTEQRTQANELINDSGISEENLKRFCFLPELVFESGVRIVKIDEEYLEVLDDYKTYEDYKAKTSVEQLTFIMLMTVIAKKYRPELDLEFQFMLKFLAYSMGLGD